MDQIKIVASEPNIIYSGLTYVLGAVTIGLDFLDHHAAGLIALATVFTAFVNWIHQRKRTSAMLDKDS